VLLLKFRVFLKKSVVIICSATREGKSCARVSEKWSSATICYIFYRWMGVYAWNGTYFLCMWICTCVYVTRVTKVRRKHSFCRSLSHKLHCHLSQYSMT